MIHILQENPSKESHVAMRTYMDAAWLSTNFGISIWGLLVIESIVSSVIALGTNS